MALKKNKGKKGQGKIEVPMASMIDVVFLLLIYFIVTHKEELSEAHLAVNLPSGGSTQEAPDARLLEITVRPGVIAVRGKTMTEDQLRETLTRFGETDPDQTVLIKVDSKASTGQLVTVLDICKAANLTELNVVSL